jgi:hypothetical protein
MSSNDALEVLKLAATYEGRLLADAGAHQIRFDSVRNVDENEKVWGTFDSLTGHLVESDAVELFRHVIHYRWATPSLPLWHMVSLTLPPAYGPHSPYFGLNVVFRLVPWCQSAILMLAFNNSAVDAALLA